MVGRDLVVSDFAFLVSLRDRGRHERRDDYRRHHHDHHNDLNHYHQYHHHDHHHHSKDVKAYWKEKRELDEQTKRDAEAAIAKKEEETEVRLRVAQPPYQLHAVHLITT